MNHQNPVLVRKIKHLTDARYFAAMGVDWMSMELNIDPASFLLWHTLRDWVEGVKLAAEITDKDETMWAKTIIDANPDGIISASRPFQDVPDTMQLFYEVGDPDFKLMASGETIILLYKGNEKEIDSILKLPSDKVFLQATWSLEALASLLDKGYTGGICLTGGDEDITGMKDYRMLDDLLNLLGR